MSGAADRPSTPADVRRLNVSSILNFLRDHGPAARSEIAEATGLVRGSITGLVSVLSAEALVGEVETSLKRGRPAPMLTITGAHRAVLVMELRVDRFEAYACDLAENLIFEEGIEHAGPRSDPGHILDTCAIVVRKALAAVADHGAALEHLTFVVAAPVFADTGHVPISVDLEWIDVDLRGLFLERFPDLPCPVTFISDARMGGWAEYQHLRRNGHPDLADMVYMKSDTGIGGIQVIGGRVLRGAHDLAFTPGHMVVKTDGELCGCGQRGCLATVAGPEVVVTAAGLGQLLEAKGQTAAEDELLARAAADDPAAVSSLTSAGEWLGRFMNLLLVGSDPEVIVLGGYWARGFEYLLPGIRRQLNPFPASMAELYGRALIRPAELGDRANRLGAVDRAIRAIFDAPLRGGEPAGS